jgi:hypothetical protein
MGMPADAAAFRDRLERHLEDRACGDELALALDRERVVVDRLLARLVDIAPDEWSVTGPFALDLRYLHCARVIRRLEIEWRMGCSSKFHQMPHEMVSHDLGDHFEFRLEQSGMGLMGKSAFSGFDAHAFLAGEFFATVPIVFHLRYGRISIEPMPTYDLLEFAGIDPVEVAAEKFRKIAEKAGSPTDPNETYEEVAVLFDPILSGEVTTGTWDVDRKRWASAHLEPGHDPSALAE